MLVSIDTGSAKPTRPRWLRAPAPAGDNYRDLKTLVDGLNLHTVCESAACPNVGESKSKVKKYLQDSPRACKIVATEDTNLAALFAAHAYPLYVLIDRDGTIAGTQRGAGGLEALRELLAKAGLKSE